METRQKKPKTKFQKVMKWMGIVELVLLAAFLVWLFGFRFPLAFYKVDEVSNDKCEITYRGKTYLNQPSWEIVNDRFAGYANGLSSWVFKSTGDDRKKFLEVWRAFNIRSRGYGCFYREDIKLTIPSSKNIGTIVFFGTDDELSGEMKQGVLAAFDDYIEDESIGVPKENGSYTNDYAYIYCRHSEYDLSCKVNVTSFGGNYYMLLVSDDAFYIPIDNDIGKQIVEIGETKRVTYD